jgi:hypothetical protein
MRVNAGERGNMTKREWVAIEREEIWFRNYKKLQFLFNAIDRDIEWANRRMNILF